MKTIIMLLCIKFMIYSTKRCYNYHFIIIVYILRLFLERTHLIANFLYIIYLVYHLSILELMLIAALPFNGIYGILNTPDPNNEGFLNYAYFLFSCHWSLWRCIKEKVLEIKYRLFWLADGPTFKSNPNPKLNPYLKCSPLI